MAIFRERAKSGKLPGAPWVGTGRKLVVTAPRFGAAINCMDGRVQEPVTAWLKAKYGLDYVDMITEAGPDHALTAGKSIARELIKRKVEISVSAHGSRIIAVVGHYDCAGNPVDREVHWEQIRRAVESVREWSDDVAVIGLWVNSDWAVEIVTE